MMREIFLLLPIFLKGPGQRVSAKSKRHQLLPIVVAILLVIAFIPMVIGIGGFNVALFITSKALGDPRLVLDFASLGASLAVFFFGFFSVINFHYLANDTEFYMALPLRPASVAMAKLFVLMIWEYIFLGFILAPALIVYGYMGSMGIGWWLEAVIVFLLFPLAPLAIAGSIVLIMMRITAISPHRDKLRIIGGTILLACTILLQILLQNTGDIAKNPESLANILNGGNIQGILFFLAPTRVPAVDALAWGSSNGLVALFIFLMLSVAPLVVFAYMAAKLYYPGILYNSGRASHLSKRKKEENVFSYRQSGIFSACLWREMRLLFRSPITFINNVIMNFIWPLFFIVPIFFASGNEKSLPKLAATFPMSNSDFLVAATIALIIFASSANGISATAISREGRQLDFLKALPIPTMVLLRAKCASGIYLSLVAALVLYLAALIIGFPVKLVLLTLFPGILAAILPQLVGLCLDLIHPYLNWDSEVKAVKHNMNVLYSMLLSMLAAFSCIALTFVMHFLKLPVEITIGATTLFLLLLCGLLAIWLYRSGEKTLQQTTG